MKYQVRITYPTGLVAILTHRDKTSWTKRTAQRHLAEFVTHFGLPCALGEA